jgi:hypothetical protein
MRARQSLHDRQIPLLQDMIFVGALLPGEALSEAGDRARFLRRNHGMHPV